MTSSLYCANSFTVFFIESAYSFCYFLASAVAIANIPIAAAISKLLPNLNTATLAADKPAPTAAIAFVTISMPFFVTSPRFFNDFSSPALSPIMSIIILRKTTQVYFETALNMLTK